jgi:hypothetical protein
MNDYRKETTRLERLGYKFEVNEEPLSKPEESDYSSYYVITVWHKGEVIGTRTELGQEAAMIRAIELAHLHQKDPEAAERKTLIE